MNKIINTLAILNTIYVILCADNPDYTVFKTPILIFAGLALLKLFYKDFIKYITSYQ